MREHQAYFVPLPNNDTQYLVYSVTAVGEKNFPNIYQIGVKYCTKNNKFF